MFLFFDAQKIRAALNFLLKTGEFKLSLRSVLLKASFLLIYLNPIVARFSFKLLLDFSFVLLLDFLAD